MSLILLCACRALVALARKRSTNAWWSAICFSRFSISASLRVALTGLLRHEGGVVAGVEGQRLVVDVDDVGADVVEEAVVVRDDDRRPLVALEELLQPADGDDVQVVRRLVEQQHVGVRGEHLGEQHAQLEAAGERRQRLAVDLARDAEPLEDLARPRLERVAVVAQDQVLELGIAVGVELGLGVGQELLLLDHRLPDLVVAHHRHLEDRHVLVAEVVLLEHAELEALGHRHRPLARLLVTGEDLQEGGLARAVRPNQAITVAGVELDRGPGEQGLGSIALTEIGDGDHRAGHDTAAAALADPRQPHRVL